ncbi:MAG TPA: hypothetical protein VJT13_09630 [Xanthobacteraceae bacterium]|nr:hypothetical protein [Xanthobacteraceae bacterium]
MRRKLAVYCEHCGGTELSGTPEFVMFHCLTFCSPDCRDDYRGIDEERREARRAVAELATVADVMRRHTAASKPAKRKRAA